MRHTNPYQPPQIAEAQALLAGRLFGQQRSAAPGAWAQGIVGPWTADRFVPAGSTVPTNGMYLPAASTVGFAVNSAFAASIDATGINVAKVTGTGLNLTVTPLAPTAAQNGGAVSIRGQSAVAATKSGGGIDFYAGNGLTTGVGGPITIVSGASGSGAGGYVSMLAGGSSSGLGGGVFFTSGSSSSGNGGDFQFSSGGGANGGNLSFQGGNATGATGQGGSFLLLGGDGLGASGVGGDFSILAGFGNATSGTIHLQPPSSGLDGMTITDNLVSTQISFFGVAPVVQRAAYTQTFSTAARTVPNDTAANLATTAATNIAPFGFATGAQADNIATQFNLLRADVLALKKVVNSLIDDSQALGFAT